jgi:hypothetical protein
MEMVIVRAMLLLMVMVLVAMVVMFVPIELSLPLKLQRVLQTWSTTIVENLRLISYWSAQGSSSHASSSRDISGGALSRK